MIASKLESRELIRILSMLITLSFGFFGADGQDDSIIMHWEGNSTATADVPSPNPEDEKWNSNHAFVYPNGEVRPAYLNPAFRKRTDSEKPLSILTESRVIGGQNANVGEVPYQIAILSSDQSVDCGGSLFNSDTVITAAHCFFENGRIIPSHDLAKLTYVAGESDLSTEDGNEQRAKIKEFFIHPKYIPGQNLYDIAVVKLKTRYRYNKYVQPLAIGNPPLEGRPGDEAVVSGWGYTLPRTQGAQWQRWQDAYWPNNLQWTSVDMWSKEECLAAFSWHSVYRIYAASDAIICASRVRVQPGGETKTKDACQGDSGGPLACYDPNRGNKKFLCGIVSAGLGCGIAPYPGTYTRVSSYYKWIVSNAGYGDKNTVRF